jgi:Zn-finger nucleic acid-binding protein
MQHAVILFRMAFICSECNVAMRLKKSDDIPLSCPSCGIPFSNDNVLEKLVSHEESIVSLKTPHFS